MDAFISKKDPLDEEVCLQQGLTPSRLKFYKVNTNTSTEAALKKATGHRFTCSHLEKVGNQVLKPKNEEQQPDWSGLGPLMTPV